MSRELAENTRAEALRLGFERCRFTRVGPVARHDFYESWLRQGYAGEMGYMQDRAALRGDTTSLMSAAKTALSVVASYKAPENPDSEDQPRGFIARYARGSDYHSVIRRKLSELARFIEREAGCKVESRPCVDTAPMLEREVGMASGIGFIGKNTMLITPRVGSYTVIGELLIDRAIAADPPERPRCGRCRICIDVCPTGAIVDEFTIDSRLCISYLTIELRGPIPRKLRPKIGNMIFGCDLCQEVCPYNTRAPAGAITELQPRAERVSPPLIPLLSLGSNQYRRFVAGTSMRRVRRGQLLRNVCVALGNSGDTATVAPLRRALTDRDRLVRGHAAWALGKLSPGDESLHDALSTEPDSWVREELLAARRKNRP